MKNLILLAGLALGLQSCLSSTTANYLHPQFAQQKQQHKSMAILPFKVMRQSSLINFQDPNLSAYPYTAQSDAFSSLINQSGKNNHSVAIQDIDRTNALIQKAGLGYQDLMYKDKSELCQLLGVDVVLSGQMQLPNQFNDLATGVLGAIGKPGLASAAADKLKMSISIHSAKNADLIWKNDTECYLDMGLAKSIKLLNQRLADGFPYQNQVR